MIQTVYEAIGIHLATEYRQAPYARRAVVERRDTPRRVLRANPSRRLLVPIPRVKSAAFREPRPTKLSTTSTSAITLRLLFRLEPHRTLVELDFTESIERFSLDPKPIPELPEKRVLGNAHEYRSDW